MYDGRESGTTCRIRTSALVADATNIHTRVKRERNTVNHLPGIDSEGSLASSADKTPARRRLTNPILTSPSTWRLYCLCESADPPHLAAWCISCKTIPRISSRAWKVSCEVAVLYSRNSCVPFFFFLWSFVAWFIEGVSRNLYENNEFQYPSLARADRYTILHNLKNFNLAEFTVDRTSQLFQLIERWYLTSESSFSSLKLLSSKSSQWIFRHLNKIEKSRLVLRNHRLPGYASSYFSLPNREKKKETRKKIFHHQNLS